ncbi:MAG: OsmC family protein [Deltaproteobacteria bacterium]|nr:OsmC family protein [Deltaproteobacteria bacterium]MBW2137595.1 OsmC family protein [Deltaproteobacteria bacterium]
MGTALDARGIPSAGNVIAHVEGDIEEIDGVLRITNIRLDYHLKIPAGTREKAERALELYAEKCPAYQTVKDCIMCSWRAEILEG